MTKRISLSLAGSVLISLFIMSCNKDNGNPTISFVSGPEFGGKDTTLMVNDTLTITIEVNWNGTDALSSLEIKQNDVGLQSVGMMTNSGTYNISLVKGSDQTEKWSFVIKDVKENQSQVDIILTKDPNSLFGPISYTSSIGLGAQGNNVKSGFLSFQTNQIFSLDLAFTSQPLIDLFYYSDLLSQATLAAPGSDIPVGLFPGYKDVSAWSIRNVSRFIKSTITTQTFNEINTDAIIINNWNEGQSQLKADHLAEGDIWLVKLTSGKLGAILVKKIIPGETGEIEFAVKIQK